MRVYAAGLLCLSALFVAGCGTGGTVPAGGDQSAGKVLFIAKCGSCHTLADAGTTGKVGPNLDDAFAFDRKQGFAESTIRDAVRDQIAEAIAPMPANIVTGQDAIDVATYVAAVAGVPKTGGSTSLPTTTGQTTTEQTTTAMTTTTATETTGGGGSGASAADGEQLFTSLACAGCHSIDGNTGVGPTMKGLYDAKVSLTGGKSVTADDAYLLESIFDPDKLIVDGFQPGIMSGAIKPGSVSQADAAALVAYIKSLK